MVVGDRMLLYGGTGAPFGLTTSNSVFSMDLLLRRWEKMSVTVKGQEAAPGEQAGADHGAAAAAADALQEVHQGDDDNNDDEDWVTDEGEDDDELSEDNEGGADDLTDESDEEDDAGDEDEMVEDAQPPLPGLALGQGGGAGGGAADAAGAAAPAAVGDEDHEPMPLYGQAVLLHDGYLYTVGGTSGFQYFMDVHRLELSTRRWERLYMAVGQEGEPSPRYRHELCSWNGHLFVLGGGTSFEAFGFNRLPGFSLATRQWRWFKTRPDHTVPIDDSVEEQFPRPRRCHSAVQSGQRECGEKTVAVPISSVLHAHFFPPCP